jgi:hypothetical protein
MTTRRPAAAVIACVTGFVGAFVAPAPAQAVSAHGCDYPRVCFYLNKENWNFNDPTAVYQQITKNFQFLGPKSRGSFAVYNTRNDDVAYLRLAEGKTLCLKPNSELLPTGTLTAIRISESATC